MLIEINFAMKSIIDADDGCTETERERAAPFLSGSVPGRGFGFLAPSPESRCLSCRCRCRLSNAKILPRRHCRSPVLSFALEVARKPARQTPSTIAITKIVACLPAGHCLLLPCCMQHVTLKPKLELLMTQLLQLPFRNGPARVAPFTSTR